MPRLRVVFMPVHNTHHSQNLRSQFQQGIMGNKNFDAKNCLLNSLTSSKLQALLEGLQIYMDRARIEARAKGSLLLFAMR